MVDDRLLALLRCPQTGSALSHAPPEQLQRINQAILRGEVANRLGQRIEQPLEEGLINQDHSLLYPVYDGIAQMLADEAIAVGEPAGPADVTAGPLQEKS
jgi:uncharacterized protein YbaR (Trm112 family)